MIIRFHLGWKMHTPPGRTLSQTMGQARWLAGDNPETNPITLKSETSSHVAEQFSWVPLPCCSLPECPFPIKSLALSVRVSPPTIHFWVLDRRPLLGPGRGPPSCNMLVMLMKSSIIHEGLKGRLDNLAYMSIPNTTPSTQKMLKH